MQKLNARQQDLLTRIVVNNVAALKGRPVHDPRDLVEVEALLQALQSPGERTFEYRRWELTKCMLCHEEILEGEPVEWASYQRGYETAERLTLWHKDRVCEEGMIDEDDEDED
jgi:hypothetical protein